MRASKENARLALRYVREVYATDLHDRDAAALVFVRHFLESVVGRLPTEEAYDRAAARRGKKGAES